MSGFRRLIGPSVSAVCGLIFAGVAPAALVTYSFTTAGGSAPTEGTRATTTGGSYTVGTNTGFDAESPAAGATFSQLTSGQFANAPQGYVTTFTGTTNDSSPPYSIDGHAFEVATNQMTNIAGAAANLTSGYLEFTVTPDAGNAVTYSSLTFDLGNDSNTTTTGSGSVGATLFASTDGTNFDQVGSTSTVAFDGTTKSIVIVNDISKDLSGLGTLSGPVTFRLALTDASSNANNKFLFIDDINLNGTIAPVPEPASLGILGAGIMAMKTRRRRRAD